MIKDKRKLLGILLIFAGTVMLLDRMDLLPEFLEWLASWYTILIAIGVYNILSGNKSSGIIMLVIGGFFLINDLDLFSISWSYVWPIALMGLGVLFLFRNSMSRFSEQTTDAQFFDATSVLGGGKQLITSNPMNGGRITCILGGAEVDLRKSVPANGAVIDIFNFMGGSEIRVPEDWNVSVEVSSILGGFQDKRNVAVHENSPVIKIKGFTILGGGEIKT